MKTQSCKAKGRRLQQLIVTDLLETFPELNEDDVRSTSMGASGEDVQLSATARRCIPYSFEAKNQERVNMWASVQQARQNCPTDAAHVVVVKKNGEKPHAIVEWATLLRLIGPVGDSTARQELARIAVRLQEISSTL